MTCIHLKVRLARRNNCILFEDFPRIQSHRASDLWLDRSTVNHTLSLASAALENGPAADEDVRVTKG